jgi:hypothetical protein
MAQITKQNFFEEAKKFIEALPAKERQNLPTIEDGSANFASWRQYFERHLGWTPHVLKLILGNKLKAMTVPTKLPAWFDQDYVEDPAWRPVREYVTPKHMRETLEQLQRRYGPSWGIRQMPMRDTRYQKPRDYSEMARQDEPEIDLAPSSSLLKSDLVTRENKPSFEPEMEPL